MLFEDFCLSGFYHPEGLGVRDFFDWGRLFKNQRYIPELQKALQASPVVEIMFAITESETKD